VAQVLLTLPYSFSQLGMVSGIVFQIFYGLIGSWTAYLISVLYVEYRARKEKENVNFKNHVIQVSFLDWAKMVNEFSLKFNRFRVMKFQPRLEQSFATFYLSLISCPEYSGNGRVVLDTIVNCSQLLLM